MLQNLMKIAVLLMSVTPDWNSTNTWIERWCSRSVDRLALRSVHSLLMQVRIPIAPQRFYFLRKIGIPMHRQTCTAVSSHNLVSWRPSKRCNPAIRRDSLKKLSWQWRTLAREITYSAISGWAVESHPFGNDSPVMYDFSLVRSHVFVLLQ